jgi:DNA-binding CsgD family transcriptional regulator
MTSREGVMAAALHRLTRREREVANLVASGMSRRQMGAILGTTEWVIKNYLLSIYDKLGVSSKLELAVMLTEPLEGAKMDTGD